MPAFYPSHGYNNYGQPLVPTTSHHSNSRHGHGGRDYYTDGTPVHNSTSLRRHASAGHYSGHSTPMVSVHVPSSSHHRSHSNAGYYPAVPPPYPTSGGRNYQAVPQVVRPVVNGHHIVSNGRPPHGYPHPNHAYYRTPSIGDRFRNFFGFDMNPRPPMYPQNKHRTRKVDHRGRLIHKF